MCVCVCVCCGGVYLDGPKFSVKTQTIHREKKRLLIFDDIGVASTEIKYKIKIKKCVCVCVGGGGGGRRRIIYF